MFYLYQPYTTFPQYYRWTIMSRHQFFFLVEILNLKVRGGIQN